MLVSNYSSIYEWYLNGLELWRALNVVARTLGLNVHVYGHINQPWGESLRGIFSDHWACTQTRNVNRSPSPWVLVLGFKNLSWLSAIWALTNGRNWSITLSPMFADGFHCQARPSIWAQATNSSWWPAYGAQIVSYPGDMPVFVCQTWRIHETN